MPCELLYCPERGKMGFEDYFTLKGKVALVTGAATVPRVPFADVLAELGASEELVEAARAWARRNGATNLGVAFAEAMAEAGADVAICDLDAEGLKETAQRVRNVGSECLAIPCDVSDEEQAARTVEEVVRHFGRLDVLINNAGIADPKVSGAPRMLHEYETDWWNRVLAVDLQGVFYFTKEALKQMVRQRGGKVINVASIWGLAGSSSIMPVPAYCTAKGALINLTRELALEYAPFGINVNVICPGFFVSRIGGCDDPSFVGTVLKFIPMGRFGYPDELKGLAIFLASDASNYITGQAIAIDGGILAK